MSASGVLRSCDTEATKFDFSSASRTSRAAAPATKKTPAAMTSARIAISASCGRLLVSAMAAIVRLPKPVCSVQVSGSTSNGAAYSSSSRSKNTSGKLRSSTKTSAPAGADEKMTWPVRVAQRQSRAAGSRRGAAPLASRVFIIAGRCVVRMSSASTTSATKLEIGVAVGAGEAQLRLHVLPAAADGGREGDDGALVLEQLLQPRQDHGAHARGVAEARDRGRPSRRPGCRGCRRASRRGSCGEIADHT